MDKHLHSRSPPSIPILHYTSAAHNSHLSYVILYIERKVDQFCNMEKVCDYDRTFRRTNSARGEDSVLSLLLYDGYRVFPASKTAEEWC